MAIFTQHAVDFKTNPPLPEGTFVAINHSPLTLRQLGFNMLVELTTASEFRKPPLNRPLASVIVMAHLDTGASTTAIDIELAKHLNLLAVGKSESRTAAGLQTMPDFAVDVSFVNTKLSPFRNLRVGSCNLGLSFETENQLKPQNFGMLIGRDIMSQWNIIWNGLSSTVIISD